MNRGGIGYGVLFGMLFLCGLGLPVPEDIPLIVSGTLRFNFIKFIIADGLAALVSGGLFMFLGYKVGQNIHLITKYKEWIALGFAIVGVLAVIYFIWRSKRHKTLGDAALDKAKD